MEVNDIIKDTPAPRTPIPIDSKSPNSSGSILKSPKPRIQEWHPRKYSQKFTEIRDVFEKKNQSSKPPESAVSMRLSSKLEKELLNRFNLTGSPLRYTKWPQATARLSLVKMEEMTSESDMKQASAMPSSLGGSPKKVSALSGGDDGDDGDEGEDARGEPSMSLNFTELCCVNTAVDKERNEELQEEGKEEPRHEQKSKQEQQFTAIMLQESGKISKEANQEEKLQEQLQQIEELQHNQEAQLEQLVLQIQKLHIKEKTKPIKIATEAAVISATNTSSSTTSAIYH